MACERHEVRLVSRRSAARRVGDRRRRRAQSLIAVAVALLLLATVSYVHARLDATEAGGHDARTSASSSIQRLLSYSPSTSEEDVSKDLNLLTGTFRSEFENLMLHKVVPAAKAAGITARATVTGSAVVSETPDRAVLLLFVSVSSSTDDAAEPSVAASQVRVNVDKEGGSWRISKIQPI